MDMDVETAPTTTEVVETTWTCAACTISDNPATASRCWCCETPRARPTEMVQKRMRSDPESDDDDDCAMEGFAVVDAVARDLARPSKAQRPDSLVEASRHDAMLDKRLAKSFTGTGSSAATRMIMTNFKELKQLERQGRLDGIVVDIPDDENGYVWTAEVAAPADHRLLLHKQLAEYAQKNNTKPVVELEIVFNERFPFEPPFVRVVRPRFAPLTGHVTRGGSICIELLTKTGWRPTYTLESLLVQLRALFVSGGAQLDRLRPERPYGPQEAKEAFARVARDHGWSI